MVGSAREGRGRVGDFYTRDRSTPLADRVYVSNFPSSQAAVIAVVLFYLGILLLILLCFCWTQSFKRNLMLVIFEVAAAVCFFSGLSQIFIDGREERTT